MVVRFSPYPHLNSYISYGKMQGKSTKFMSHYETIGVHETAIAEEIKKAYRERSKKLHPDANDGDDKGFAKLAKAYEVLSNPDRRKKYDDTGIDTDHNEVEQVNSIIAGLTLAFLEHAPSVKTESLTDFIKKQAKEQLGNAKSAIAKSEKEIDRAENAKNRVVRKELGHNLILSVFENKISEARTAIIRHNEAVLLFDKVLEEIESYSYLVDVEEKQNDRYSSFETRLPWHL